MNIRYLFLFALIATIVVADFQLQQIDVTIKGINKDGTATIQERFQFLVKTPYSKSLYQNVLNKNDLSSWSTTTGIKNLRLHINPNNADIQNFRVRPQPLQKCNPFLDTCRGELILEYTVLPLYNKTSNEQIPGTGLFSINKRKPRTVKYTINPASLLFTSTDQADLIIEKDTYLNIEFPEGSTVMDVNPLPEDVELTLPTSIKKLSWTNTLLVKFALEFEVEDSLDKEVSEFFSDLLRNLQKALTGEQGIALMVIILVLLGSYLYLRQKIKESRQQ